MKNILVQMMKVKVRYQDILYRTEKAVLFLIQEKEVWLPKSCFNLARQGRVIHVKKDMAVEKNFKFSELRHVPKKIAPVFNQEPKNELKI